VTDFEKIIFGLWSFRDQVLVQSF